MKVLLLAAGLGARLRPITDTIPKCLVPIHETPLLQIWLARVFHAGLSGAVVNLHYLPDPVKALVAKSPWRDQITYFDEPTLLGTAGTLSATRHLLGEGPVMVVHADNLSAINLVRFQAAHSARPPGCIMTMALFDTDSPRTCGIVELDSQARVTAMHEKDPNPPGTLANAAVYIIEPELFDLMEVQDPPATDISTDVIPQVMGRIYSYKIEGYHRDIGSPQALAQAHQDLGPDHIAALMAPNERP